jgi:hypothetical protein
MANYWVKIDKNLMKNDISNSGKIDLPSKFVSLKANQQLFPAITLYKGGDSVSANFGKEQFLFDFAAEIFQ